MKKHFEWFIIIICKDDIILINKIKTTIKILITDTSNYVSILAMNIWNKHFCKYPHSVFIRSLFFINLSQ